MKSADFRRVLIVDDDTVIRDTLRILLRGEGFDVVGEASDGVKAMEQMRKHKPAIVLLDITMPGMSGLEVLEEIRTNYPETLVVMISGEAHSNIVKEAIMKGAVGYIVKPFNMSNVIQNLKRALQIGVAAAKKNRAEKKTADKTAPPPQASGMSQAGKH